MPDATDPSIAAYARVFTSADRTFDAVEALEELGGIARTAESAGWTPKAIRSARTTLEAARDALDRQLAMLADVEAARSPKPAPRRYIHTADETPASAPLARRTRSRAGA